jgi:hypothetical protein
VLLVGCCLETLPVESFIYNKNVTIFMGETDQKVKVPSSPTIGGKNHFSKNNALGLVTVYSYQSTNTAHKRGFAAGVAFTVAAIGTCTAFFWLGMNKSEEIIKKKDAELLEKNKQIVQLTTQIKSERKRAQDTISKLVEDIMKMTQSAKKNEWNNFYKAIVKANNDAEGAKKEWLDSSDNNK